MIRRGAHIKEQFPEPRGAGTVYTGTAVVLQIDPRNVGGTPDRKFAVAVLSDDEGVHIPEIHPEFPPDEILQPRGV